MNSEIALIWIPQDTIDESTLTRAMAWFRQVKCVTWANAGPDLRRHMASLDHNGLKRSDVVLLYNQSRQSCIAPSAAERWLSMMNAIWL